MGHAGSANASTVLGVLGVAWGLLLIVLGMVDSKLAPQLLHLVLHRHSRVCRTRNKEAPWARQAECTGTSRDGRMSSATESLVPGGCPTAEHCP